MFASTLATNGVPLGSIGSIKEATKGRKELLWGPPEVPRRAPEVTGGTTGCHRVAMRAHWLILKVQKVVAVRLQEHLDEPLQPSRPMILEVFRWSTKSFKKVVCAVPFEHIQKHRET